MPTLFTMSGTCALAPNIAIAWLNAPIEIHNLARGDHKKEAYLKINPKGKVPALQFDDGDVLTEAAAILVWLGSTYESSMIEHDEVLRHKELEALSYMTSEVHATYGPHFDVKAFANTETAQSEVKEKTYEKLSNHYDWLDKALDGNGGDWFLGRRSLADPYLYVLTRWLALTPLSIETWPALQRFRHQMEQDTGVRQALGRQDMTPINGSAAESGGSSQ